MSREPVVIGGAITRRPDGFVKSLPAVAVPLTA